MKYKNIELIDEIIEQVQLTSLKNQQNLLTKSSKIITLTTVNGLITIEMIAYPLSTPLRQYLQQNIDLITYINQIYMTTDQLIKTDDHYQFMKIKNFIQQITNLLDDNKNLNANDINKIISFGPNKAHSNILINRVEQLYTKSSLFYKYNQPKEEKTINKKSNKPNKDKYTNDDVNIFNEIISFIISGFHLACQAGPLCEEPMMGVCFIINNIIFNNINNDDDNIISYGSLSGQVMSIVKEACRQSFAKQAQRICQAMFKVIMQCDASVIGAVESVLMRRMGRIISTDDIVEGTTLFILKAYIPVSESFGLAHEIRQKTGGAANPQLIFSHWEVLKQDPYWKPTTTDELEDYGHLDSSNQKNIAYNLLIECRKRKKLPIIKKIVEHADKQRTIGKNK